VGGKDVLMFIRYFHATESCTKAPVSWATDSAPFRGSAKRTAIRGVSINDDEVADGSGK